MARSISKVRGYEPEERTEDPPFRPTRRFKKKPHKPFKSQRFALLMELLHSFAARTGHTLVPREHKEGNFTLGKMVHYVRALHRAGDLPAEHERNFERLPRWAWDSRKHRFEHGLALLRRFVKREGHTLVPDSRKEDGFPLGTWVDRRRSQYAEGALPREHALALEAVPGWAWSCQETRAREAIRFLREFAAREGHTSVPQGKRILDFSLSIWVWTQRRNYKRGTLSKKTIRALQSIPHWSWAPIEDRFLMGLRHLRRFAKREGHYQVPQRHREAEFPLGAWVSHMRAGYKHGSLSGQRIRRLEKLTGWTWSVPDAQFARGLRHARRFAAREGHALVPRDHREDSFPLDWWVVTQRQAYKFGTLTPARIRALENLPGWTWDAREWMHRRGSRRAAVQANAASSRKSPLKKPRAKHSGRRAARTGRPHK